MPEGATGQLDVVVVGAGQAGLSMGHFLAANGLRFVILDAAARIGNQWRGRWDSLLLFTPAEYSCLPGLPFPAPPGSLPTKDQVADYLETYAHRQSLPVALDRPVTGLRPSSSGYVVETAAGQYGAPQVVVATGAFQRPWAPTVAAKLSNQVRQLHSSAYRNPDQMAPGEVLVVGSQASGCQIAEELAVNRRVHLSTGRQALFSLPQRILGKHPFWWLDRTRVIDITIGSRLGRWASTLPDPSIGVSARRLARRNGVDVLPRLSDVNDDEFAFADGRRLRAPNVVWATGYRHDFSWIDVPGFAANGKPYHDRGVTPAAGLYVLGLGWQHTRGSALIGWVGRDAEFLAGHIVRRAGVQGQA